LTIVATLTAQGAAPTLTHGPLRGHCDTTSIHVWARADAAGDFTLHLARVADGEETTAKASATAEHDFTLHFCATDLQPGAAYEHWITHGDRIVHPRGGAPLVTAAPEENSARIAFGSCAHDKAFREQAIWGQLLARAPQGLVLLGDTPYIDTGDVSGRRRRYREFLGFGPVRATLAAIPTWTTWDDHDYAVNDQFGAVKAGETARPTFVDYHAHASYGDGERGIYTSFRRGPLEVFLLDARTFADREESPLAPGARSLLGRTQIEWLQRGLLASKATFRVLATGMVWNGGVRPGKKDCWGNWREERDALLRWIGSQRIHGLVLVAGDVHRTRVVLHPTADLCGYDVPELITSPLAGNVLASNKQDVPGLVFDAGEGESCLLLSATGGDRASLRATFIAGDGREFHHRDMPLTTLSH